MARDKNLCNPVNLRMNNRLEVPISHLDLIYRGLARFWRESYGFEMDLCASAQAFPQIGDGEDKPDGRNCPPYIVAVPLEPLLLAFSCIDV